MVQRAPSATLLAVAATWQSESFPRPKKDYLNGVLGQAEIESGYRPARKLWKRRTVGYYVPAPDMKLRRKTVAMPGSPSPKPSGGGQRRRRRRPVRRLRPAARERVGAGGRVVLIGVHERRRRVTANRSALELRDVARLGCEGSMKPAGAFRLKRDGETRTACLRYGGISSDRESKAVRGSCARSDSFY